MAESLQVLPPIVMKTPLAHHVLAALLGVVFTAELHAQSTAFTYQGRLNADGTPYTGLAEMQFGLWSAAADGSQVGNTVATGAVAVTNGLFSVPLDFGDQFPGADRWLEIAVRPGGSTNSFDTLSPRQPLTPVPYALHARTAASAGSATSAATLSGNSTLRGTITFDPSAGPPFVVTSSRTVTDLDADTVDGRHADAFWQLNGNAGTTAGTDFVGTTDDVPLELRANNEPIIRLSQRTRTDGGIIGDTTYTGANILSGHPANAIADPVMGATVLGGGYRADGLGSITSSNRVTDDLALVAGGAGNTAGNDNNVYTDAAAAAVLGGIGNHAQSAQSLVAGGSGNRVEGAAPQAFLGGGLQNIIQSGAPFSAIVGGSQNTNRAPYAMVAGGEKNEAAGSHSFAAGQQAKALHPGAWVWADRQDTPFASTADNQFLIRAGGGVGIGTNNPTAALEVAGGVKASEVEATGTVMATDIEAAGTVKAAAFEGPMGMLPLTAPVDEPLEVKVNGARVLSLAPFGTNDAVNLIAGSQWNTISDGLDGPVEGATIAGGGEFSERQRISANYATIGGGHGNTVRAHEAVIGGGVDNEISYNAFYSTIGGGKDNRVGNGAYGASISGGTGNLIEFLSQFATIGGGSGHEISDRSLGGFIGGGTANLIRNGSDNSTIAGGRLNSITNDSYRSFIGGGKENDIHSAANAMIPGGEKNLVTGDWSLAAGRRAQALHDGTFVWADDTDEDFASTSAGQFLIRAANGVGINKTNPATSLDVNGTVTADGVTLTGGSRLRADSGSAAAPSLTFNGDTDMGIYRGGNNVLGFSALGQQIAWINSIGLHLSPSEDLFFGAQTRQMINL
ncbi:MAG TPA: hypothetical protein DCY13_09755, partial [Verrucomicrobiales bacterium]|nr:hypothetical protein [Verrucomicrobiales bacterium]